MASRESAASNLVGRDTNHKVDVFVRDLATGKTSRVSVSSRGAQAGCKGWCESTQPSLSTDGRYVAFGVLGDEPRPGDTNKLADVFVRDRRTGRTERVSVTSKGKQAGADRTNNGSNAPSISGDGRYVAFHSADSNLVPGDTNRTFDIFVHDRKTGRTTRISVSSAGRQANGENVGAPSFSADGRYVAFNSLATNLVPGDTKDNDILDVFVRDLRTGTTTIASLGAAGEHGGDSSAVSGIAVQQRRPGARLLVLRPELRPGRHATAPRTPSCASSRRKLVHSRRREALVKTRLAFAGMLALGVPRLRAGRLRVGERSLPRQARLGRGDHHRARADRHARSRTSRSRSGFSRDNGLVAVRRAHAPTQLVATAAMNALLEGPTPSERSAGLSSAVPLGTRLLGIAIHDGLATVDLTSEYQSGGGALSMQTRLGQVVCTLTQFPTVQKVRFRLDGTPVNVFSSEGIVLKNPVGRSDYADLLPAITVDKAGGRRPRHEAR